MNKKGRIVIIFIIITIIVIALSYFINSNTVYFGSNTRALVVGKKIIKRYSNKNILLKKVNYYKDGKVFSGYLKSNKDDTGYDYYLVSKYNKKRNVDDILAAGSMIKINVISSDNIETFISEASLNQINQLLEINITTGDIVDYKKYTYDIDNDSSSEDVVFINYFIENVRTTKLFVIDDEDLQEIKEFEYDFADPVNSSNEIYYLSNVVDINKDGIYEIVVARIDGDSQPTFYDIYQYSNGTIKEIK